MSVSLDSISLFSNCGAGDLGYSRAGFRFRVLAELREERLAVAQLNHPRSRTIPGDLRSTLPLVLDEWQEASDADVPALLAACPPCQGFSSAQSSRGHQTDAEAGSRDTRNLLVEVVVEATKDLKPRAVVVENVSAFLTRLVRHPETHDAVSGATYLIDALADDYAAYPMITDLSDYGVPQTRIRSFLTLLRRDDDAIARLNELDAVPYPAPTHVDRQVTLRKALDSWRLPTLDASSADLAADEARSLHQVPVWDAERYRMVACIPPDSASSAWSNSTCVACRSAAEDPNAATCAHCGETLPRPVVIDDGVPRLVSGFRRSSYTRMDPSRPASTVTTASGRLSSDRTLHPNQNRVMSILECQKLQTIPEEFDWGDTLTSKGHMSIRAMIGEAVPPRFTRQHGRVLAALLQGRRPYRVMLRSDPRVRKAERAIQRAATTA